MVINYNIKNDGNVVSIGSINIESPHNLVNIWHPTSGIWNLDNYKDIFNQILDLVIEKHGDVEYVLNTPTEVIFHKWLQEKDIVDILKEKFRNKKLSFLDGNVNTPKTMYGFPCESQQVFWGGSSAISHKFNLGTRNFMKHFTCIQSRWTESREEIYQHLYENNLLYKTFFTFCPREPWSDIHYKIDDGTNFNDTTEETVEQFDNRPIFFYPNQWYRQAFVNILCESAFYDDDLPNTISNKIFFTEKTEKCFTAKQPFILVGSRYGLKHLHSLGFKTFDKWWSEEYDNLDDKYRMDYIKKIINDISKWSLKKCFKVFEEMLPILNHNQKLNASLKISEENDWKKIYLRK